MMSKSSQCCTQVTVNYGSNPMTPILKVCTTQLPLSYIPKTFWSCHDPGMEGCVTEWGIELSRKRHGDCGCIRATPPQLRTCNRDLISHEVGNVFCFALYRKSWVTLL